MSGSLEGEGARRGLTLEGKPRQFATGAAHDIPKIYIYNIYIYIHTYIYIYIYIYEPRR